MANTLKSLQTRSASAVQSFKSLITSLKLVNEDVAKQKEPNNQAIQSLTTENTTLDELHAENTKIIENFENLLK